MKKPNNHYVKFCKLLKTYNSDGKQNGWLLEMMSEGDGWTENLRGQIYLTLAAPKNYKGYHTHAEAMNHFACLKGKIKLVIYTNRKKKREVEMGDREFKIMKVFPGEAHCMINDGTEEARVLTYRYPQWSEENQDILTISPSEILTSEAWKKIESFKKSVK